MKKIVSLLLLFILIVSISASAMISSNATSTKENLDYSRFEIEYLMNTLEHDGTTINGSVDVYNQVMTEDLFHRGIRNYFAEHNFVRGFTAASAQVFNSELNLIDHPEHFYTVVLLDILQSNELDVFNSDSIKSSLVSNTQKVYEKVITQLADDFTGNSIKVSELTKEQIEKVASSISSTNGSAFGVYGSVADVCEYISIFVDYGTSLYTVIERINQLYAVAGANSKTIEVLNNIYSNTSNSDLKKAINYIKTAYEDLNSPAELKSEMSKTGVSIVSYTVDRLLSVTAKVVVSKVSTVMKILLIGWEIGVSLTNAWIDAGDLSTGYLLVDAAAIIENALRSCMSSYRSSYNSSKTANNAENCREAYRLTLATQYYATNMMQKLGYSLASFGSTLGALKSFFGCDDYQTIVEICDSTRNIIRNRYYKWVGLAERMYEIVYDVNLDHALSVPSTPVSSVSFKRGSVTMFENECVCNIAIAYPTNAVGREITYSSSDTSVAKVGNDGKITAVSYGTATITATSQNGTKGTCKVTILPYWATIVDGSYTIDKFTGGAISADIPDSVRGISVTKIADNVFRNTSVISVTIPDSVTSIGSSHTFAGCTDLKSVTIGDGVTSICDYTFDECYSLISVEIGESVTSIGDFAFNCSSIKSITIPDSVTSIGSSAFYGCTGLTSITIPDSITSIENETFRGCTRLTSVTISDSVTSIGNYAFYNCRGIKELTMPVSAKIYNSEYTFGECKNIKKITLTKGLGVMPNYSIYQGQTDTYYAYTPWYISCIEEKEIIFADGVLNIGDYAFYKCAGLLSITISGSVTSISKNAFLRCPNISAITVEQSNSVYSSDEVGTLFNKDKTVLLKYPGGNKRTTYTIPYGVNYIDEQSFKEASNLKDVTIPESVTTIGTEAFSGCGNLENVTISDSVSIIGDKAFLGCLALKSITIPESVTTIGTETFSECSNLENVTISDSVSIIGDRAFWGCLALKSITIPESVTMIGTEAFSCCDNLENVIIEGGNTTIGEYAFACNYNLNYVTLGEGVVIIDEGAFSLCDRLVSIKIPDSVTTIGQDAFASCTFLTNLVIGKGVATIDYGAFSDCGALTNLVIPENVTTIGEYAFYGCLIKNAIIYGKETTIEAYAFSDCIDLTNLILGNGIVSIQEGAFEGSDIMEVCYLGTQEQWDLIELYDENIQNATVYFEEDTDFGSCGNNTVWNYYPNGTLVITGAGEMWDSNYYDYDYNSWQDYSADVQVVVIGNEVTKISSEAFSSFENLTDLVIGDSVTTIGEYAFSECTSLENVVIGNNVNTIEMCAFEYCRHIYYLTIPQSVTTIGTSAFRKASCRHVFFDGTLEQMNMISGNLPTNTHYKHIHSFDWWEVTCEPTLTDCGSKEGYCSICSDCYIPDNYRKIELPEISLSNGNTANIDFSSNFVSGFNAGSTSLDGYLTSANNEYSFICDEKIIGTGSVIKLIDSEMVISQFHAVIFGDVNGDSWYDGQDAVLVSCLANGMLTKDDVSEAVYMAADCNHDGVIDQADVALLNEAGTLLANVDQSKPAEVLLETSAEYVEYLDLIDQSPEIEAEDDIDIPEVDAEETPETDVESENTTPEQDAKVDIFEMIMNFIKSIFEMILDYIPVPI